MSDELPPERLNKFGKPLPTSYCPDCGYEMDAATLVSGGPKQARPVPGDFTCCLNCGTILQFGPDMQPVLSSADSAGNNEKLRYALLTLQAEIRKFRAKHYPKGLRNEPGTNP